ncbi:AraC family transcriptional regulator [Paenibacillus psychroresistens]|uniref:AraC family transcriptional regulator n=1 Tax=Paenibacillus psychroresistens TaxID=1778678 RepID=A0A6B8RSH4_9BACL|nr:AraC family transcriptional regulator [Paenibacillus psychroresistens]QGQ98413.1 AraC family transcriptional regulator [Paenibacillus psychroresistens]
MSSHLIYYYQDFMEQEFPFKLAFPNEQSLNQQLHAHEHFQICFLMRGVCLHHVENQVYLMTKGDMLAIPPFVPHRFEPYQEEKVELVQIDFMPIVVDQDEISLETQFFPKINISAINQDLVEQLITSMKREHAQKESGYQLLIKADLIRLLITIFRESNKEAHSVSAQEPQSRRLFNETVRYIEIHYADNLQLEIMAQKAAMSTTYFSYMFKVLKGQPFVQFVNEVRIRKALDLLRLTEMSIQEIGYVTGFNTASHFNRMFKKRIGLSPSKYRQQTSETVTS